MVFYSDANTECFIIIPKIVFGVMQQQSTISFIFSSQTVAEIKSEIC